MRVVFVILFFLGALPTWAQRGKNHQEDLSVVRPRFAPPTDSSFNNGSEPIVKPVVPPTHTVNKKVDVVLDSLNKLNVLRKFVDGFTIQIYSGQNREEANETKKKMTEEFSDMKADLQYLQPKFRVKTGSYFTRLEAQKDLMRLKRGFPNAILVPERIALK
jgi:hypothetical protein